MVCREFGWSREYVHDMPLPEFAEVVAFLHLESEKAKVSRNRRGKK